MSAGIDSRILSHEASSDMMRVRKPHPQPNIQPNERLCVMFRMILSLFFALTIIAPVRGQDPVIWVASPWQHVLRSTEPGEARSAEISAARNEYETLRVIIRAGAEPLLDVRVSAGNLSGPAGQIPAKSIELFKAHYIDIFEPSRRSKAPTGWYPDALIPLDEIATDENTDDENADAPTELQPMKVQPGMNQGIWVDVHVPRDTAPGEYSGVINVAAAGESLGSVPVTVQVQPFTLPDEIAMRSNFGRLGNRLAKHLALSPQSPEFASAEDQYIDLLLDHRAIPSSLGNIWPKWTPEDGIDDSNTGERLRMMVEDRHVNSLRVPLAYRNDPEKCRTYLRDMADYLRSKGWLDLAYIYLKDEPNDAQQYETVRQQGELIRQSGIKRMCTEQTLTSNPDWGTLYGAVDIWCPLWSLYDEPTAQQRQKLGEEIWTYTALCQGNGKAPFWQIDFAPVQFRAPFWVSWHYRVKGFLYWSSIYWPPGKNPWTAPHFRDQYWGEGMLLYPGKDIGLNGPVPSIRLKLIREALEDFEYMTLAAELGHQEEVDAIVTGLTRSFEDWSKNPRAYQAARAEIAALIANE